MASNDPQGPQQLGYYFALSQVGMEMVVPIGAGVLLDRWLDWQPWGVVGGAAFGFFVGIAHLVVLSRRNDETTKKH